MVDTDGDHIELLISLLAADTCLLPKLESIELIILSDTDLEAFGMVQSRRWADDYDGGGYSAANRERQSSARLQKVYLSFCKMPAGRRLCDHPRYATYIIEDIGGRRSGQGLDIFVRF